MRRMPASLSNYLQRRLLKWLDRRVPASHEHHLNGNSIFILPSGFGWSFIILSLCLFLLGTNYQNNLMLLLSYLCLSIMLLTLFYTHQNFARLALKATPPSPFHCNLQGELQLQVIPHAAAPTKTCNGVLAIKWLNTVRPMDTTAHVSNENISVDQQTYSFSLNDNEVAGTRQTQTLRVPLSIPVRGRFALGRLTIACDFPLGLYKCWTHLDFDQQVTVYAKPQEGPVTVNKVASSNESDSVSQVNDLTSNEDFYALNDYEVGQPLNRVSWKHVAKNGNWVSKSFASLQSDSFVLSVPSNIDVETAVSALTYATLSWTGADRVFGIQYKGLNIAPAHGVKQMHECLSALACLNSHSSQASSTLNKTVSTSSIKNEKARSTK